MRLLLTGATGLVLLSAGMHLWDRCAAHGVESTKYLVSAELPSSPEERREALDREMKAEQRFAAFADGLATELQTGKLSLDEAVTRLSCYCLARYPIFFMHIEHVEPGYNLREKIARNMLREFYTRQEGHPSGELARVIARLESEFRQLSATERAREEQQTRLH